jgi:hypothetical protein
MNKKPLSLAAIRRVATQLAERRFALGLATRARAGRVAACHPDGLRQLGADDVGDAR